jgi:5S rRNA maturation endonuclease (ribonuclease M5)
MKTAFDKKKIRRRCDRVTERADVRRILIDLGLPYEEKKHGDLWFPCTIPTHKDRDASAHIEATPGHPKHGIWNCFGCETSGDIVELVRQHLNLSFFEAILWAEHRLHSGEVVQRLDNSPRLKPALPPKFKSPETREDWPERYINYLLGRGIPWWQITSHGIGYCDIGRYKGRIIVPVTLGRTLRTWVGRNTKTGQRITSLKHGLPGLFGSQHANIKDGPAIVVEGWTDKLKVERLGFPNCMAVQTNKIHESQMEFLERFEFVILMPDGDEGGVRLVNSVSEYLDRQEFFTATIPWDTDPDSAPDEEVVRALDNIEKWKPIGSEYEIQVIY